MKVECWFVKDVLRGNDYNELTHTRTRTHARSHTHVPRPHTRTHNAYIHALSDT